MIDEATTPLIISGSNGKTNPSVAAYQLAQQVATQLKKNDHYIIEPISNRVHLTESGMELAFRDRSELLSCGVSRPWRTYVEQALRASLLMERDVDYVVVENEVRIVDQYTGRIFKDRSWRDGLHQAVEVKENAAVSPEKKSLARISRQRYFQRYRVLSGMTGTADGNATEFRHFLQTARGQNPKRIAPLGESNSLRSFA